MYFVLREIKRFFCSVLF